MRFRKLSLVEPRVSKKITIKKIDGKKTKFREFSNSKEDTQLFHEQWKLTWIVVSRRITRKRQIASTVHRHAASRISACKILFLSTFFVFSPFRSLHHFRTPKPTKFKLRYNITITGYRTISLQFCLTIVVRYELRILLFNYKHRLYFRYEKIKRFSENLADEWQWSSSYLCGYSLRSMDYRRS